MTLGHIQLNTPKLAEVEAMYEKLKLAGYSVGELDSYEDYMQFRFPDPTGYVVEVFWEPPPNLWQGPLDSEAASLLCP